MPINYDDYAPNWPLISRFIRTHRAKNKCEFCGAPNGKCVSRLDKKSESWVLYEDPGTG